MTPTPEVDAARFACPLFEPPDYHVSEVYGSFASPPKVSEEGPVMSVPRISMCMIVVVGRPNYLRLFWPEWVSVTGQIFSNCRGAFAGIFLRKRGHVELIIGRIHQRRVFHR